MAHERPYNTSATLASRIGSPMRVSPMVGRPGRLLAGVGLLFSSLPPSMLAYMLSCDARAALLLA
jgi:hypothetical protein